MIAKILATTAFFASTAYAADPVPAREVMEKEGYRLLLLLKAAGAKTVPGPSNYGVANQILRLHCTTRPAPLCTFEDDVAKKPGQVNDPKIVGQLISAFKLTDALYVERVLCVGGWSILGLGWTARCSIYTP